MRITLITAAAALIAAPAFADESHDVTLPSFAWQAMDEADFFGDAVFDEACPGQEVAMYVNRPREGGSFAGFAETVVAHQMFRDEMFGEAGGTIRVFSGIETRSADERGLFGTIRLQDGAMRAERQAIYEANADAIAAKNEELSAAYARDTDGFTQLALCMVKPSVVLDMADDADMTAE